MAPVFIKHLRTDPQGCFVILVMEFGGKPYTLVNVYVPPPFTKTWFECLMGIVLEVAEGPLLFARDFNTVLDSFVDRFGSSTQSPTLC